MEYDVNKEAWDIYNIVYINNVGEIKFKKDVKQDSRPYIKRKFTYNSKQSELLRFSGETDFNFSKSKLFGFGVSRYEYFKKLLGGSYEEYQDILENCFNKFYSRENLSLMPKTGNLQSVKKNIGNDRLDVFVCCLNEYYCNKTNFLFNYCSYENIKRLQSFLSLFESAYEYCTTIYHIDKVLTKDLIVSGSKAIDSKDRVIEYMNLAIKFWKQKQNYLEINKKL